MSEQKHPAIEGAEEYAKDGRVYYKSAAVSQRMIGVGAILQGLGTWAIFLLLLWWTLSV